jgi:hypothetical protein
MNGVPFVSTQAASVVPPPLAAVESNPFADAKNVWVTVAAEFCT